MRVHRYASLAEAIVREKIIAEDFLPSAFEDESFPPIDEHLYFCPDEPPIGSLSPNAVQWCRAGEILGCVEPRALPEEGQKLGEARQGCLGDSWLISALNALVDREDLIRSIFASCAYGHIGLYTLRFFAEDNGAEVYVHVSDTLPCAPSGQCMYASCSDPNLLWPALIEKALAKCRGCYEAIGLPGCVRQCLQELTGGATVTVALSEHQEEDVWRLLQSCIHSGAVGAAVRYSSEVSSTEQGLHYRKMGILPNRAYSIFKGPQEVSSAATPIADALSEKMVHVSNHWGTQGSWISEEDLLPNKSHWDRVREKLTPAGRNCWWMPIHSLCKSFTHIIICSCVPSTNECQVADATHSPEINTNTCIDCWIKKRCFSSRWVPGEPFASYSFSVDEGGGRICASITPASKAQNCMLGLLLINLSALESGTLIDTSRGFGRAAMVVADLPQGQYALIPMGSDHRKSQQHLLTILWSASATVEWDAPGVHGPNEEIFSLPREAGGKMENLVSLALRLMPVDNHTSPLMGGGHAECLKLLHKEVSLLTNHVKYLTIELDALEERRKCEQLVIEQVPPLLSSSQ
jgi:hypothetical protein